MTIKTNWIFVFLSFACFANSQNFSGVYKIDRLLNRIQNNDTTFVINFWATWCKPCVEELPAFDSLHVLKSNQPVKVILVNLDFAEEAEKKVIPFLLKHSVKAECIILDEVNGNNFIDKISPNWSGAIPATLIKKGNNKKFIEKKTKLFELMDLVETTNRK